MYGRTRRRAEAPDKTSNSADNLMNNDKVAWQGSFVAVVTPFGPDGTIDWDAFGANLDNLLVEGAHGLVVSGCTGESWSLTDDEKIELFRRSVERVDGAVPVIAGTGALHTRNVVDVSLRAKAAGVAGIMVLSPYYCRPGRHEIIAHYRAISDEVSHPILLYNIPSRVGRDLTADLVEELADLEWVVAIKESSDTFLRVETLIGKVGDRINVFAGHSAERAVPSILMGAKGFVSSMESQIMGQEAIGMYALVQEGRIEEAAATQIRTLELDEAMRAVGTFPANLKAAMNELGRPGGYPRPPLLALDDAQRQQVGEVLDRLGILPATRAA
jgi:4-hydroxy-tetrahydrodipicolinate synthase